MDSELQKGGMAEKKGMMEDRQSYRVLRFS